jgi:hypothetical protein
MELITPTRGRPKGRTDTPKDLLRRAMHDSAKLAARARKILGAKLNDAEITVDDVIAILQALDRSIESSGKLLVPRSTTDEAPTDAAVTRDKVLSELQKGKKTT